MPFLTFSPARARKLASFKGTRAELADRASGVHATLEAAVDYAERQGPMLVLSPDGEIGWVERKPTLAADRRAAEYDREYAEIRRLTPDPFPAPRGA